ncbi:amino acid ABC transporter permease [Streptomyces fuscichromogenes]|uniref:amino acid ABC transporter permease n=1 Tax=Streptomyces fuscichromogenes TaxID=1324013 RepID=UPI0037FD52C8
MSSDTLNATQLAEDEVVFPRRRYGQWISAAVVVILALLLVRVIVTNDHFQWDVVGDYFTTRSVLVGLARTLQLTAIAMVVGLALGLPLAVMRQSSNRLLRTSSFLFVWFFRGTPVLVQIIFWFNLSALFPTLSLGIPGGPTLFEANTNTVITPLLAAILALGLNQGAYTAEIVRSGLLAVDQGQTDAAAAIGMTRAQTLRKIVLPQAMRVIVPPLGSETISMLKVTSLVSVISLSELLYSVQAIYQATYQVIPLLLVASIWYLIVVSVLSVGQYFLERHFGRGTGRLKQNTSRIEAAA